MNFQIQSIFFMCPLNNIVGPLLCYVRPFRTCWNKEKTKKKQFRMFPVALLHCFIVSQQKEPAWIVYKAFSAAGARRKPLKPHVSRLYETLVGETRQRRIYRVVDKRGTGGGGEEQRGGRARCSHDSSSPSFTPSHRIKCQRHQSSSKQASAARRAGISLLREHINKIKQDIGQNWSPPFKDPPSSSSSSSCVFYFPSSVREALIVLS